MCDLFTQETSWYTVGVGEVDINHEEKLFLYCVYMCGLHKQNNKDVESFASSGGNVGGGI